MVSNSQFTNNTTATKDALFNPCSPAWLNKQSQQRKAQELSKISENNKVENASVGYDSYIDTSDRPVKVKRRQKYPYRKQFTMPKRLPSRDPDDLLEDRCPGPDCIDLVDHLSDKSSK